MSLPDTLSFKTLIDTPVNPTILPTMKSHLTVLQLQAPFQAHQMVELNTSY